MNKDDIDLIGDAVIDDNNTNDNGNLGVNQEDVSNIDGNDNSDITGKDNSNVKEDSKEVTDDNNTTPSTGELNKGDILEIEGKSYSVDDNGNIVDENGNVFKEAKDVKEWLNSVDVADDTEDNDISISSIQKAIGIELNDENGKPVEFSNDIDGIKSFINTVVEEKTKEAQEATMNRFYNDNPLIRQFQDYVQLTGSPKGFGDIPDRSGIILDKDNEQQLMAVIAMAAKEFGNVTVNKNYLTYLKESGALYDEAKTQLKALVDKDEAYRKEIETKASEQRKEEEENTAKYWNNVNNIINGRIIAGYKIPDSFTKTVDGKKITITTDDFFDYLSAPSVKLDNGRVITKYQNDLANLTDEEYLNKEMLDAWLMFTGGTYKDLIDMAVKEDKVRQLKIISKNARSTKSVKIIKKADNKASINDIIL